jgi:tryptophan synthase alpha chain
MNRIAKTFSKLKAQKDGALIAYITGGDPNPSHTPMIAEALIKGGADIIELGIPFSDPIADGPTIQEATVRALKAGTTPKQVLEISEEIRKETETPIVILTYYNPIYRMGLKKFFESAKASGIDGIIVPDLPIEEAGEYKKFAQAYEIDTIFIAAPSTSTERLEKILKHTSGFLYLVSIYGVTGARKKIQDLTIEMIRKTLQTTNGRIPLAVGFGISKPDHVETIIRQGADAPIVGSGFVKIVDRTRNKEEEMLRELSNYANQLKRATIKVNLQSR